jgi:predicted MPP superfamily phosphohydrolase
MEQELGGTKRNGKRKPLISRRGFLRAARNALVGGVVSWLSGWKYLDFERGWLKYSQETFKLAGLPASFSGVRIAHLSDLHFNDWMTPMRFEEAVELAKKAEPDLILVTGDFIDRRINLVNVPKYINLLKELKAPRGKFAVLGNHDHKQDASLVRHMMAESGFVDVSNRVEPLEIDGETIFICGLDSYKLGRQDIDKVLSDLPDEGVAILMVHEPDYADISSGYGRFSLQLSGHSHGGQIYIPLLGPPVTPLYGSIYPRGRYKIGEMQLYTNRGIGMVTPYVRLNCRPEIAAITLEAV